MENGRVQAWLAGYARGGENEAARAVQAYTAFFGAPAAKVGPAYATGGAAPIEGRHGGSMAWLGHGTVSIAPSGACASGGAGGVAATSVSPMAARPIAFEENTTLETACERLCAMAARYNVAYEGKFAGKTLRANPGDKPQYLQHRFWNEP